MTRAREEVKCALLHQRRVLDCAVFILAQAFEHNLLRRYHAHWGPIEAIRFAMNCSLIENLA